MASEPRVDVLEACGLVKHYHSRCVVNNADLVVHSGEVVGLLGANGAGKTTMFRMIVGIVWSDKGTIRLNQIDLTHMTIHMRARIGLSYLPQESSIFRKLTVAENILAILETRSDLTPALRQQRLYALLAELHVSHLHQERGSSLSGGERRRVEIARALASEPRFILLDEPFAAVDPIAVKDVQAIIKHLSQINIGVLITDHNVRETLAICDRAYIVSDGTMIAEGSADEILHNEQVREVYLGRDFN